MQLRILLPLFLACALMGCRGESVVTEIQLDVQACMKTPSKPSLAADFVCGATLPRRIADIAEEQGLDDSTPPLGACLVLAHGDGEQERIHFSQVENEFRPTSAENIDIEAGEALSFRLFVLKPHAADAGQCADYDVDTPCASLASCFMAYGKQVRPVAGGRLKIEYGSEGIPCGLDCNDCRADDSGCRSVCAPASAAPSERCNGEDDDCDGTVDEGEAFAALNSVCSGGGECGPGLWECAADGAGVVCSTAPGGSEDRSTEELCDSDDNDCDGQIDEGVVVPEQSEGCPIEGVCEGLEPVCDRVGEWVCPFPDTWELVERLCDGLDNDCNGTTDEDCPCDEPGLGRVCGSNIGECETGLQTCGADFQWSECVGQISSVSEQCDGLDNDCDGEPDNGNPEGGDQCGVDLGECQSGVRRCLAGELVCEGEVRGNPELCNGLDDDCDGMADNDNPEGGESCGSNVGECSEGFALCQNGDVVCRGERLPEDELCDGLDNDCDGQPDEAADLRLSGVVDQPCGDTTGACEAGHTECSGGGVVCVDAVGPSDELCDGLDNDCDGEPDDGNPGGGALCGSNQGECRAGVETCIGGDIVCNGAVVASPEICDGDDNDCDGDDDEDWIADLGTPCQVEGQCGQGQQVCAADGAGTCCSADPACSGVAADVELCDGQDNDCDVAVDETFEALRGLGTACAGLGECPVGVVECSGGVLTADDPASVVCSTLPGGSAYGGADEQCDGRDNDCDGQNDEDFRDRPEGVASLGAPCGVGACAGGEEICNPANRTTLVCSTAANAGDEQCNGADDDCDGPADEGFPTLGLDCEGVGACGAGQIECFGAQTTGCSTDPGGSADQAHVEVCNGADDDCNGTPDDGFVLQPGGNALGTECQPPGVCPLGVVECAAGGGSAVCSTGIGGSTYQPAQDLCDGLDNDCDGQLEEDTEAPPAIECLFLGVCAGSEVACDPQAQTWACDYGDDFEEDELSCDGQDNDCDGFVDEDLAVPAGLTCDQDGICAGTQPSCVDGGWSCPYPAAYDPNAADGCDGQDTDCDGDVDEDTGGLAQLGEVCDRVAPCSGTTQGVWNCADYGAGLEAVCEPGLVLVDQGDYGAGCVTFSRNSEATYVAGAAGNLALAPADQARFAYDAALNESYFLREGERTNSIIDSRTPGAGTWSLDRTVAVAEPPPHGSPDEVGSSGLLTFDFSALAASWAQPAPCRRSDGSNLIRQGQWVSLSGWFASPTPPFLFAVQLAGGAGVLANWYAPADSERQQIARQLTDDGGGVTLLYYVRNSYNDLADGTPEQLSVFGPQIEEAPFASSYIPTGATAATRASDSLTVDGALLRPEQGTYFAWFRPQYAADSPLGAELVDILHVSGVIRLAYDGANDELVCSVGAPGGTLEARVGIGAGGFDADSWIGAGCRWNDEQVAPSALGALAGGAAIPAGVTAYFVGTDGAVSAQTNAAGFVAGAVAGALEVAPEWALSCEVRLARRSATDVEIATYLNAAGQRCQPNL